MAQKTYKQIQEEANRLFGDKPSTEKFDWRRSQQRAAGLDTEGKRRGGFAGAYDRNKKLVSTAATAAGYFLGGPAGAAATRGLIQGFDRPGKSGVGFDFKRGAKGAAEGYGAGKLAQFGQSGLQKLMGGKEVIADVAGDQAAYDRMMENAGGGSGGGRMSIGSLLSGAGKFIKENPQLTAAALQTGLGAYQGAQEQAMAREQMDLEEQLREEERERRRRLAQLLAPALQAQSRPFTSSR